MGDGRNRGGGRGVRVGALGLGHREGRGLLPDKEGARARPHRRGEFPFLGGDWGLSFLPMKYSFFFTN